MAAAATSASGASFPAGGAHRAGFRPHPTRVAATASMTAAAPLKADLPPAAPVALMRVAPESLQGADGSLVGVPDRREEDVVGDLDGPGAMEYLAAVLTSNVYDVADETPLELAKKLSRRLGVKLYVKREDKQPVTIKLAIAYSLIYILRSFRRHFGIAIA